MPDNKIKPVIKQLFELAPYALLLVEIGTCILKHASPNVGSLFAVIILFQLRIIYLLDNKK